MISSADPANWASAGEKGKFYTASDVDWFNLPNCPFTAPEGFCFIGWLISDTNEVYAPGIPEEARSFTITAQWGRTYTITTTSMGELGNWLLLPGTAGAGSKVNCGIQINNTAWDAGYRLQKVTVVQESGTVELTTNILGEDLFTSTPLNVTGGTFKLYTLPSIIMPESNLTFTATFGRLPTFAGHSLSLAGDIGVNFYVNPGTFDPNDLHVVFTWNDEEPQEKTVNLSDLTAVSGGEMDGCYKLTANVAAKEMTDEITATVYSGTTVLATETYSVRIYCSAILNDAGYGDALRNLVKYMLIYGAKAQVQFDHTHTGRLADEDLTEADRTLPEVDASTLGSYGTADLSAFNIEFLGSSLILESKTTHRLYFESYYGAAELNEAVTVRCGSKMLTFTDGTGDNMGLVYVDIPEIAARNVLKNYTLTFTKDGAATAKLKVNAGAYIYNVLNTTLPDPSDRVTQPLKDVVSALYWYSTAAEAYFSAN